MNHQNVSLYQELNNRTKIPKILGMLTVIITLFLSIMWSIYAPINTVVYTEGLLDSMHHTQHILNSTYNKIKKIYVNNGHIINKKDLLFIVHHQSLRYEAKKLIHLTREHYHHLNELKHYIFLLSSFLHNTQLNYNLITENLGTHDSIYYHHLITNLLSFNAQIVQLSQENTFVKTQTLRHRHDILHAMHAYTKNKNIKQFVGTKLLDIQSVLRQYVQEENLYFLQHSKNSKILLEHKIHILNFVYLEYKEWNNKLLRVLQDIHAQEIRYFFLMEEINKSFIRSPIDGEIANCDFYTYNNKVLDIVPLTRPLIIRAEISAKDINYLQLGTVVKVKIYGDHNKTIPRIAGKIIYISPDIFYKNVHTGVYKIKIGIDYKKINQMNRNLFLRLGTPVQIYISKNCYTPYQYFYSNVIDSFHKSFTE